MAKAAITEAYPLQWPDGWDRTQDWRRERSRFSVTLAKARDAIFHEVELMGGVMPVLSTNIALRLDGLPYANQPEPEDPGAALYFEYAGNHMCFACDAWDRVRDNIQAVRKTVEALRGIERWGASDMMERAFTGFQSLPAPGTNDWRGVLGLSSDAKVGDAEREFKRLALTCHPDKPTGDAEQFRQITEARDSARREMVE